jgi:hypothetical protein
MITHKLDVNIKVVTHLHNCNKTTFLNRLLWVFLDREIKGFNNLLQISVGKFKKVKFIYNEFKQEQKKFAKFWQPIFR